MADVKPLNRFPSQSDVYVAIHFPVDKNGLRDINIGKLKRAEELLRQVGVKFAVGQTDQGRDWFFDWGMSGAVVLKTLEQPKVMTKKEEEELVLRVKVAAVDGDEEAQHWLEKNGIEWKVK